MDRGTQTLLSVALLLALNNALVRLPGLGRRPVLFWGIQGLDLLVAGWLLWRGVPGFEAMPAIGWMLGLLLVLHVVQNIRHLRAVQRRDRDDAQREQRASAIRAALEGDDEA